MKENLTSPIPPAEPKSKFIYIAYITLPLLVICTLIIAYLFFRISQVERELRGKDERLQALGLQLQQTEGQLSTASSKLEKLNTSIDAYLDVEGRSCSGETSTCLDELTDRLASKEGFECSSLPDNVCPQWCTAGADYDCCIQKLGYEWIQGRGCHSK